jgi:putative ABC transport system permease protein
MNKLMQDFRFALRQIRRAPGFAAVAIATLALSIGIATAVFSVLDATIVRPLPFNQPESIVMLQPYSPQGYTQPASYPQYQDWKRENTTLSDLAGYSRGTGNLEGPQGPVPVRTVAGTDNFFRVFDVKPMLGRTFVAGEDQPGRGNVVVLSYELWQQSFAASPNVIGTSIKLDGDTMTVIGVMPAGFRFPLSALNALYRPLVPSEQQIHSRGNHWLPTVARLKPGVTVAKAQADLGNVFANVARSYPDEAHKRIDVKTISGVLLGQTAGPLTVLSLAVLGVLAIGCVNLAGLLLARGVRREREFSLRSAVGAARSRIIRQLLTETAVLSFAGAAIGTALSYGLLQLLRQLLVASLSRGSDIQLNLTVLGAALGIALVTGFISSILPALHFSHVSPSQALRAGGSAGTSRAQNNVRSTLIVVQVAIALGLMTCSSLLLRNLHSLRSTDPGFSTEGMLTEPINLTTSNYAHRSAVTAFYQPLLERVRAIPGVESAAFINLVPIDDYGTNSDVQIVGHPPASANQEQLAELRFVTPDISRVFGARLLRGRLLSDSVDTEKSAQVMTVNQAFVDKFFAPGEDPIGKQVAWDQKITIVGVTSNLRQNLQQPPLAEMDFPAAQQMPIGSPAAMSLVVHTKVPPESIEGALREAMHRVDPTVPFRPALTMDDVIAETLTFQRLESWLFGIFAALALLLSLVGIFGMVNHEVELRTREIGIRMALGSTRGMVLGNTLRRVSLLMLTGVAMGLLLTGALHKVLASVVEIHAAKDAWLLCTLAVGLAAAGVLAGVFPAHKAASVEPTEALRME